MDGLVHNRYPTDCVHAWVDAGLLNAGQSRTLHGKVYFIQDSKEALLDSWQKEFGGKTT
jgi:hypothetical protein